MARSLQRQRNTDILKAPTGSAGDVLLFDNHSDSLLPKLLTIDEVANLLGISPTGVRRLQQQRNIPFVKVGGSVRFLLEDVISYVRKQRVEAIG
jgi:excisionase family DNA binding protein